MVHRDELKRAAAALGCALREGTGVVALTGAGISVESGLGTFRGAAVRETPGDNACDQEQALWSRYDPMQLATPGAFRADPELVTRWYDWRRGQALRAQPNAGHAALAELERLVPAEGAEHRFLLATQNVDGLHQRAGSRRVEELHGTIVAWRCSGCGVDAGDLPERFAAYPPVCVGCGGLLRPGVVWFGEALPEGVFERAAHAAERCGVFLAIGTSAVVYPAATLAEIAHARGAFVIEVNPTPTLERSGRVAVLAERACAALPALVSAASAE